MHCVLGDVMIATLTYLAVALAWRQLNWPRQRLWAGGMMLIAMGLGYTVFSEWYNVYRIESWAYSDAMPLAFGIGITPLLQWLVVPAVMLVLIRRTRIGRSWRKSPTAPLFIFF
jgi:branched-subunit amino acid ABC-type transport system permease component